MTTPQVGAEQELVARARANDRQVIGELYDRYAACIYRYVYRRIGNVQVAEDLTGDVFVKVLEAIQSKRAWHLSFQAWLYRIAHNVTVDWYRSRRSQEQEVVEGMDLAEHAPGPSAMTTQAWAYAELHRVMHTLPDSQQQVLILRFSEGLKTREIAEILGKSVGAVEALQHRALTALKERLADDVRAELGYLEKEAAVQAAGA